MREAAEKAKIELSSTTQTEINLPFITADKTGPKHINIKLTRAKLEALVEDLVKRTLKPCHTALKDSGYSAAEINEVVLVGGMTRMPKIVETVKKDIKKAPYKIVKADNNDAWLESRGKKYSPSQISAFILQKMKQTAEKYLGQEVKKAVITVPAYFNSFIIKISSN